MQMQTKLRSRLGPAFVLALLLVLGLIAGLQQFRHPVRVQEPASAFSAEKPPAQILTEDELLSLVRHLGVDPEKRVTIFSDEDANSERQSFDGEPFFVRSPRTGVEVAEAHNLFRMRSYQERVSRQLKSRTPILPVSLVPTLEETIFENSSP